MTTPRIGPTMTVLEIVHRHPDTQAVFHSWDEKAKECIMCKALFETVEGVCTRYGLDLDEMLADLEQASGPGHAG